MQNLIYNNNSKTFPHSNTIMEEILSINFQRLNLEYNDPILGRLAFQKLGNVTYTGTFEYVWGIINQLMKTNLEALGKEKLTKITEVINQLIQSANNTIFPYVHSEGTVMSICEVNAANYVRNNKDLSDALLIYTNKIKEHLRILGKNDNVCIMLQKSPEIEDFGVLVLNIDTEYADLDEKLDLYDEIGDILNDVTNQLADENGEKMYDELAMVTYSIEEHQ